MRRILVIAVAAVALAGCKADPKHAWDNVIKNCISGHLAPKNLVYMGPSSSAGPGSVFSYDAHSDAFSIEHEFKDMHAPAGLVFINNAITCSGKVSSGVDLKAAANASLNPANVSGSLSTAFATADSIDLQSTVRIITIKKKDYNRWSLGLPATDPVKQDLDAGGMRAMTAAVLVSKFTTTIVVDASVLAEVKADIKAGPLPASQTGDLGASVSASWKNNNQLVLTSDQDFYIAAQMTEWKPKVGAAANATGGLTATEQKNISEASVRRPSH